LFHFVNHAGGQKSARANQRVASPIQKPRITGDDRFALVAAHDKLFGGAFKLRASKLYGEHSAFRFPLSAFDFFRFRRQNERCVRALCQRNFKPAGTVSVAAGGLAARLLDRMRNVFAPFRLRMIFASVGENAELAVAAGVNSKPQFFF
jgi:hypothetical protein